MKKSIFSILLLLFTLAVQAQQVVAEIDPAGAALLDPREWGDRKSVV